MRSVKNALTDAVFRLMSGKYGLPQGEVSAVLEQLCSAEAEQRKETG